ncbi:chemotaxis protein CheB [Dyadobacter psychrotolerans]|uniref:protein-glutamate methylesterase n=1 Tax=Dyadobacter psychrotolerans TaxID=2541721 RepID=A0A4R5DRS1_9BACT|nr:chemotaxis protein CheB [Dyadobacter psychrotolerans]TDE17146.1 chemotaxis protein CheB [Dyadobacter psychrotolerans]
MADIDVIVIGSSAGGVMALKQLVAALPADFKTPVFVVQHLAPGKDTFLADILDRSGPLHAIHPVDGTKIEEGTIYVSLPDHHMLVESGHILIKKGPKENRFRPSIDALFRSAAYSYGPRAIGIVLTGMLDDGCSGMWSLKRLGGITIVQDPEQALYPSMPLSVLEYIAPDHVCPLSSMSELLVELTRHSIPKKSVADPYEVKLLKMEVDIAALGNAFDKGIISMGEKSSLTCPECGGALDSYTEGKLVRYRCHTGHAYSSASLLSAVNETTEHKLWAALRSLEEAVMIVEKDAAVNLQIAESQLAPGDAIKIQTLKHQATQLHNFLNHYLQLNDLSID